ncbi:MAG: hypothetical protein Kow0025_21090 [Thermodesulfovibrionales bacterium]
MSDDFTRVKERVDLLSVITQETGLRMKGHHLEECPFCQGHDCFSIKSADGFFKCFQCDAGGDVINFLEQIHGLTRSEALKRAAAIGGVHLDPPKGRAKEELSAKDMVFIEAADYYHGRVGENGGRDYLVGRRAHKEEVLRALRVGWSDGGLVEHLRGKGFTEKEIEASGLARNKDGVLMDFFGRGQAIFPHLDGDRVLHFTKKDPSKQLPDYQLPADYRAKEWHFYNQGALKYDEVIVVEGENDVLSVLDEGVKNVIGLIGQPSDLQIKAIRYRAKGKRLYLWLDNDEDPDKPRAKGKGYVRKICEELAGHNIRVVVYPDEYKDPDEYLKAFQGDRKKEIRRLLSTAVDPISWEVFQIGRLDTLEKRLKALEGRKVFQAVAEMVEAEKEVFIEKLEALGFTRKAVEEKLEANQDLKRELAIYFEDHPRKDADPNEIATKIFRHFSRQGRFFRDRLHNVFLLNRHTIYTVGNNRPFNALMLSATELLPTKEPGRSVWESLASQAFNKGIQIDVASWINTDRAAGSIFVNLNGPNNSIIKISREAIEEIPNGLNRDKVLLRSSAKILPVNFLPDVSIRDGMRALKELVFDSLTCEREQRYLILCWLISAFLLDFSPYMGLMKFSGASESGKTTAAKLLSLLIYGTEHLGDPSAAAAYAVSSQNPLLIIDNLESDDFTKSILKFLLLSATKGGKEKRTQGTDSETIQEQPKALVLITAIEPFTKAELINRTYDIEFSSRLKRDDFVEYDVISALVQKRDLILSAILRFIHKEVLPNLERRRDYIAVLKKEYRGHAKSRTDEYLSLLMLMLERLLAHIPLYDENDFLSGSEKPVDVYRAWIEYQDRKAKDTETASNTILKLLDGLAKEYLAEFRKMGRDNLVPKEGASDEWVYVFEHPLYRLTMTKGEDEPFEEEGESYIRSYIEFTATSGDIAAAFDRYCRENGLRNPYSTASVFASRLKNDRHLLEKGGWELVTRPGIEPHFRKVRGERFWKFRKVVIR